MHPSVSKIATQSVSSCVHSSTLVTAEMYLIIRIQVFFSKELFFILLLTMFLILKKLYLFLNLK